MPASLASEMDEYDQEDILDNIHDDMHVPMEAFVEKYFGEYNYFSQDDVLEIKRPDGVELSCKVPSDPPSPDTFLLWLSTYVPQGLGEARGAWHIESDHIAAQQNPLDGGNRLLLNIPSSPAFIVPTQMGWDDVQVVGQFYTHKDVCYKDGLLALSTSAHKVFDSQPARLFLHGFYIRESLIELWIFDRSGLYCSEVFDWQEDFAQFLSIAIQYRCLTDQELGKSDLIKIDENGSYVDLYSEVMPSLGKLTLDRQPLASHEEMVGKGMTCYRARRFDSERWEFVVKFTWRWLQHSPENVLLERVKDKGVRGSIYLEFFKEYKRTADWRSKLRFDTTPRRKFAMVDACEMHKNGGKQPQNTAERIDGFFNHTQEAGYGYPCKVLTCIVTSPLGRGIYSFKSRMELLRTFRDAIDSHRSLLQDARILHQDVSPGNIIIVDCSDERPSRGILIDLDCAIELDAERVKNSFCGTTAFMAIGALRTEYRTYRHDLEGFLYTFLWVIISNRVGVPPTTSKLQQWKGQWNEGQWNILATRKAHDMEQGSFTDILNEFPPEFHAFKQPAERLRQSLFPLEEWSYLDGH